MIAVCPKCGRSFVSFANIERNKTLQCRWCGKYSQMHLYTWKEDIIQPFNYDMQFIRASEIPRGNFAKVFAEVTDKDIKITYPLDQKFEMASCKDILQWEARYCKTGASE